MFFEKSLFSRTPKFLDDYSRAPLQIQLRTPKKVKKRQKKVKKQRWAPFFWPFFEKPHFGEAPPGNTPQKSLDVPDLKTPFSPSIIIVQTFPGTPKKVKKPKNGQKGLKKIHIPLSFLHGNRPDPPTSLEKKCYRILSGTIFKNTSTSAKIGGDQAGEIFLPSRITVDP